MATFNRTQDDLMTEIQSLKDEMLRLKSHRGDNGHNGDSLLERGRRTARALRDKVSKGVRTGVDTTQHYIQERPWTTTLVALGLGLIVGGWYMRRRG
jgi:ElaB/YqjD/DUF883 family membrane-anchored ribosome-binding protein